MNPSSPAGEEKGATGGSSSDGSGAGSCCLGAEGGEDPWGAGAAALEEPGAAGPKEKDEALEEKLRNLIFWKQVSYSAFLMLWPEGMNEEYHEQNKRMETKSTEAFVKFRLGMGQDSPPATPEASDFGDGQGFSHLQVGRHTDWHLPHGRCVVLCFAVAFGSFCQGYGPYPSATKMALPSQHSVPEPYTASVVKSRNLLIYEEHSALEEPSSPASAGELGRWDRSPALLRASGLESRPDLDLPRFLISNETSLEKSVLLELQQHLVSAKLEGNETLKVVELDRRVNATF